MGYLHHTCVLLLSALVVLYLASSAAGDFCNEPYEVTVRTSRVEYVSRICWYYYPCRYYYWWWWYHYYWRYWHCRYVYYCNRWRRIYYYKKETRTRKVCCDGYKGKNCDIPICTDCGTNGVCIAPETCFCGSGSTGDNCELKTCGVTNNCYPGTCDPSNGQCKCSSGFAGPDCATIKEAGILRKCSVEFQDENLEETFNADCGTDEYGKTKHYYTNDRLSNWLVVNYELYYDNTKDLPGTPSWIGEAPMGLTGSYVRPTLYNAEGTNIWTRGDIVCNVAVGQGGEPPSKDEPYLSLDCDDVKEEPAKSVQHDFKLMLNITSTSGGFKRYLDGNNIEKTDYFTEKTETEAVVEIIFDLEPPVHCKDTGDCKEETETPCEFFPDITKHGSVSVEWDGWRDADSGVESYTYTVYKMKKNDGGQIVEGDVVKESTTLSVLDAMPDVSVDEPGLYSIILEVADAAGNIAKARSLLLYDNSSVIEVLDENPLSISGAHLVGSNYWIVNPQPSLSISWNNRYINRFLHDNEYLNGIKGMADVLDDEYGNFTVNKVINSQGITEFGILVSLDLVKAEDAKFDPVDVQNPSFVSSKAQNSGTVIYVYVSSSDILGNSQVEYVPVGVDTTKVILDSQNIVFTRNENMTVKGIPYASSVSVPVEDPQSGILSINYTLYNTVVNEVVIDSSQPGQQHPSHTEEAQCTASGDCSCAALGGCFNKIQKVWINNCLLEGLEGRVFKLEFTVYNGAGMKTSHEESLGKFEGIRGLQYYPAPHQATYVTYPDAFYKVTLFWEYLPSCYKAETVIITYTTGSTTNTETMAAKENTFEVDNLLPDTDYEIQMEIQYEGSKKSDPVIISFTSNSHPGGGNDQGISSGQDGTGDSGPGLGIGAIVGIVVVGIIVAVLLAAVIVLLVRRKQNKPMVPPAVRGAGSRIRDRFSRMSRSSPITNAEYYREEAEAGNMHRNLAYEKSGHVMEYAEPVKSSPLEKPPPYDATFKVAYVGEDDDDIYTYGNMDTDEDATWKVSNDRLIMGKALPDAKGKFADLKLATLQTDSGSRTVVAKMNKVGATDLEKLLMTAKMNFLATGVPANENLLQFVAAVPPPQGPMILMEHCTDGKLSDWLKNQSKVTSDVEDSMINFTIQVAAGMTHLHAAEILHRRLGARNILLTMNKSNQLVAKVSGFGPMKGEQVSKTDKEKSKGDRVPFKWMAPEQYEVQVQGRVYTPMTDVWSYGILLHEIFSKGEQPYPDMSVGDVKAKVAKGYRMPKEKHCPDYVYDEVMAPAWSHSPDDRPTFEVIHTGLKGYFQGGGGGQEEYVYDANE